MMNNDAFDLMDDLLFGERKFQSTHVIIPMGIGKEMIIMHVCSEV
jgi:hypothetical protein